MEERKESLLAAALDVFMRYGVRKTTMGDVAEAAGISRPTLYAYYSNKDELWYSVIDYANENLFQEISELWATQDKLSAKLDIFFEKKTLRTYETIKKWPDAEDVFSDNDTRMKAAHDAIVERFAKLMSEALQPFADRLAEFGQSPDHYAHFIVTSSSQLKLKMSSRAELEQFIHAMKASVLALTGAE